MIPERHLLTELYGSLEPMAAIGTWRYVFGTRRLVWSGGVYGLLGLDPLSVDPSYDLFAKMTHPDDRLPIDDLGSYLEKAHVIDREFRIIKKSGAVRWLAHKAEVFQDADNRPFMALGILLDVTARVEATRARDAAESRLRTIAQATNCFTWVTRRDGYKAPCQGWMDLTGQTAEESSASGWLNCIHVDDRERTSRAWHHAVATGTVYAAKYRVVCRDGIIRWFIARAFPVPGQDGELKEWYGVGMDISDVKAPDNPLFEVREADELTGRLIKAARALLNWSIGDLARASGISVSSIRRIEAEPGMATRSHTMERLVVALGLEGIEFRQFDTSGSFVRWRGK